MELSTTTPESGGKKEEYEKRYLIVGPPPDVTGLPRRNIRQGYLRIDPEESLRIRLFVSDAGELEDACVTSKLGTGARRPEDEEDLASPGAARLLHRSCKYQIRKVRHYREGWVADFFQDELSGLVLAEYESPDGSDPPPPPDWLGKTVDVTDTVSNAMLAKLAFELKGVKLTEPLWRLLTWRIPRVVITGPPGGGKSGGIEHLKRKQTFSAFHFVPEVATIVFGYVGRPGTETLYQQRFSRGIGDIQMHFETIAEIHAKNMGHAALVMDRGLGDGFAYNPRFDQAMEMSRKAIHGRYDLVIYMALPSEEVYSLHQKNNPARIETYAEASALGQKTFDAWEDHPNFITVNSGPGESWEGRMERLEEALRSVLARP